MTTVLLHDQAAERLDRPQPSVRVVRGGKTGLRKAGHLLANTLRVLAAALLLGLIVSVVYSQAKLTELNGQINTARAELTAAGSEYDYLSTKRGEITSRSSLQEVAEGRLGLVKLDASQITYVRLEEDSVIEKTGDSATRFLAQVRTAALSLLGNLNP